MDLNFWKKLKEDLDKHNEPLLVLAPMADVTDSAFRRTIAKYGKPSVMWTEFVSADGLVLAPQRGKEKLMKDLLYNESERPIVAQFFTSTPEYMEKVSALAVSLGFDGVDINMGCPDKGIERQGAGASLIKNPKRARELICAAKQGVRSAGREIPVSVKTRIGYNKNEIETWLRELLAEDPVVVTIHARTRKEMSKVPAHFEVVARAVEIRNEMAKDTLILGNGGIESLEEARKKIVETKADGMMLGKAIFGNPWLFGGHTPSMEEKLKVLVEHTKLFQELLGGTKNFSIMKKHYKAYVNDFIGAKELRTKLMETNNAEEVEHIVLNFLNKI